MDVIIVLVLKIMFRRHRPSNNHMDMFLTVSVDQYSFPSGHATRAVMLASLIIKRTSLGKMKEWIEEMKENMEYIFENWNDHSQLYFL